MRPSSSTAIWSATRTVEKHDLVRNRYLVDGLDNERRTHRFSESTDAREFSPNALTYEIR